MNQRQKFPWWRNRTNQLFALVSVLVYILILVSIIVDDMIGTGNEIGFWEWVGVLIIPVALLVAGIWLNNSQIRREETATNQHAQDEALRQYLDQMSNLLIDRGLRAKSKDSDERRLAQARTMATLLGLDGNRKKRPLKLIYELDLIKRDNPFLDLKNAGLDHADFSELTLQDACLKEVDLRCTNLSGADLKGADLRGADLRGADHRDADLSDACLADANLLPYDEKNPAKLNGPNLSNGTDPSKVDLTDRSLIRTKLNGANLRRADLSGAFLTGAEGVTADDLEHQCGLLERATMPDGTKHD
jgi:hypothetical protein